MVRMAKRISNDAETLRLKTQLIKDALSKYYEGVDRQDSLDDVSASATLDIIATAIGYKRKKMNKFSRRDFCAGLVAVSAMSVLPAYAARDYKAKPFVKWAGGKNQLIEQLEALMPGELSTRDDLTYVEPFVGGGAILFYMLEKHPNIKNVIINDFNTDLICAYKAIKELPDELIKRLAEIQEEYKRCVDEQARKEYYLLKRDEYNNKPKGDVEVAALFIFLNRTCFNGLYRVNSKGAFNVPFGRAANPLICDEETIRHDSKLLQKVTILSGDFEGVYNYIKGSAFIYFDPPYRPLPNTPSFTAYSKNGFNDEEQKRLASFCRKLDKDGHKWLLSNSDPANTDPNDVFFNELYDGFELHTVSANRMINSKAEGRGKITELAICNYEVTK